MAERWRDWFEVAKREALAFQAGRNGNNAGEATTALAERIWDDVNRERGEDPKRELLGFEAVLSGHSVETMERESDYYAFLAGIVQGYARLMPAK